MPDKTLASILLVTIMLAVPARVYRRLFPWTLHIRRDEVSGWMWWISHDVD
jgi:hypothetical protein